jgi:hypothetical protein
VDAVQHGQVLHKTGDCDGACTALTADQWLANDSYWTLANATTIVASQDTVGAKKPSV